MLFPSRAYRAALNALLAEHDLSYIELIPENPFAAKLRNGIIAAMRAGCRTPFDENSWIATFNHAERIVQLNFVAFGFNELGMPPILQGAEWQSVQNPLVIRNIERNLDDASRYIERKSGKVVRLRRSKLSLEKWGLADLEERPTTASNVSNTYFMSELPHPEANKPLGTFRSGDVLLRYYENPRTIGSLVAGIEPAYKYPQVVVVCDEQRPLLIVRIERNDPGGSFLCSLDANGKHSNFGPYPPTDRDTFVKKAGEVIMKIKYGEGANVVLNTLRT